MGDYIPPAGHVIVEPAVMEAGASEQPGWLRVETAAAPARPGHFAEREELDAALKAGTAEALLLFIDRHPQSRYRAEAEAALRQIGIMPPSR